MSPESESYIPLEERLKSYDDVFYLVHGKVCFVQKNWLRRLEVEPEAFLEAAQDAEALFGHRGKSIVTLKMRQLLKDDTLNFADKITLQANETFPKNDRLCNLMLRDLSTDLPEVRLSPAEKAELEENL